MLMADLGKMRVVVHADPFSRVRRTMILELALTRLAAVGMAQG